MCLYRQEFRKKKYIYIKAKSKVTLRLGVTFESSRNIKNCLNFSAVKDQGHQF